MRARIWVGVTAVAIQPLIEVFCAAYFESSAVVDCPVLQDVDEFTGLVPVFQFGLEFLRLKFFLLQCRSGLVRFFACAFRVLQKFGLRQLKFVATLKTYITQDIGPILETVPLRAFANASKICRLPFQKE